MNHTAHFKGDIQVDGFILDADGNPIAGGGPDFVGADGLDFGEDTILSRVVIDEDFTGLRVDSSGGVEVVKTGDDVLKSSIYGASIWQHRVDWESGTAFETNRVWGYSYHSGDAHKGWWEAAPGWLKLAQNADGGGQSIVLDIDEGSTAPALIFNGDARLQRAAAGILENPAAGGGIRLHSPDGTAHTLTVSDAGALVIS